MPDVKTGLWTLPNGNDLWFWATEDDMIRISVTSLEDLLTQCGAVKQED